ncbi:hypothetical protein EK21DRAFT_116015 [Setomelanomma holmii]|uniref:Uncharacterized protein n=1 Tax=Setomelanomma holmii TaxID=210430 RepID=A0A9P4H3B0_9PLEO|nr:hypothetical protein EK21DRAFT_116015 [Setomelanomma holmii]
MAATTHNASRLQVAASDDMDLYSDSGLDFDDGDIDLDLDAPPQRQDDDPSIKDATTDAVQYVQAVTADQDDFMIDHEDFFEQNIAQNTDTAFADSGSGALSVTAKTATPVEEDEDLIDYSDDEDEPVPDAQQESRDQNFAEAPLIQNDKLEAPAQHAEDGHHEFDFASGQDDFTYGQGEHGQDEGVGIYETPYQPSLDQERKDEEAEPQNDVEEHAESDDGGVQLEELTAPTESAQHQNQEQPERPLCETRLITINYEGNELWLFKEHDTESSGDWLLEDISVVHSSLSELLQACRTSLGEDISHETELGLRFDHLHNMELYEDNTACVAVSLERLLDLYYTLHSQDGNDDPESFYICLLSRPRFATLLSDVAKHAEEGSGYSGFNAAVAAGDTHFGGALSGDSTEQEATEWENEEEKHESTESASEQDDDDAEHTEHEEHNEDGVQDDEEHTNQEEANAEQDDVFAFEETTYLEQVSQPEDENVAPEHADITKESAHDDETHGQTVQQRSPSASKQQTEQVDDDTVHYSDDDEPESVVDPSHASINAPSPSSSTVQGDDVATGEPSADATSLAEPAREAPTNADDTCTYAKNQHDRTENSGSYQNDDQPYNEEDPFQGFQNEATDEFSAEADFEGFTNQGYAGFDYQHVDQQLQNDFLNGGDFDGTHADDTTNAGKDHAGDDDYLNLTEAPEWTANQDQALPPPEDEALVFDDYTEHDQEEEDGLAEQTAVAASSAADPVAASSTDLHETSPQGQKRSIDEVGDLVGDALDSTGASFPYVPTSNYIEANDVGTDTKRPRV